MFYFRSVHKTERQRPAAGTQTSAAEVLLEVLTSGYTEQRTGVDRLADRLPAEQEKVSFFLLAKVFFCPVNMYS